MFKVGGKIFALAALDEVPPTVNLKCDPDLALDLRDRSEQVRAGYHMNKRHWNTVEIDRGIPAVELWRMIDHSYELVVKSLPKKARANKRRSPGISLFSIGLAAQNLAAIAQRSCNG